MGLREEWAARTQDRNDPSLARVGGSAYGSLTGGGIVNNQTGMGGAVDHAQQSFFTPTRIYHSTPLEILLVESWAARHAVSMPVDDQFIKWRTHTSDAEAINEKMAEAEDRHKVTTQLAKAMRAARQYGSAVLALMTAETGGDLTLPLIPERIRPGDLSNLLVLNRFEITASHRSHNLMDPNYGRPKFYDLYPRRGGHIESQTARVHHSRVLRFDGLTANTDSGYSIYDWDWGMPTLVPVILSLLEDQTIATAIAHLSQEASIPILSIAGLGEARAGLSSESDPDAPDVEQIGAQINRIKSVWRLLMMDKNNEEFERVAVAFAGLADLMDRFAGRVAAAAQIPQTRFMGRSPAGLNATGDSDMENYVSMVEAERAKHLPPILTLLDSVLARDAGMREAPEYEWGTLLEQAPKDEAEAGKIKAEAVQVAIAAGTITEDEGREMLSGDPVFGALAGKAPGPVEPPMPPGGSPFGGGPSSNGAKPDPDKAAAAMKTRAEGLAALVNAGIINEEQAQARAEADWGDFEPWAYE